MPRGRITKRTVEAFKCCPGKDREVLWDDKLSGFGVIAFPSGRRVYTVQFRKDGRSRRISIGDHGELTAEQARDEAEKALGGVKRGIDPLEERRKARAVRQFDEVSADFLKEHVAKKRKAKTLDGYEAIVRLHILPTIGKMRGADIRRVDVLKLYNKLSDRAHLANKTLAVLSSIWNWAAHNEEPGFGDNPAKGVKRNDVSSRERFLSSVELTKLGDAMRLAETEGLPWKVSIGPKAKHARKAGRTIIDAHAVSAIRLLILTGARLREILHAKWDHVDFERGIIFLPDSKTGAKPIYLSSAAQLILETLPRHAGNPHLFPGEAEDATGKGKPRNDLKRPWEAITSAAGLDGLRLHDLRHSFASVGAGASLGLPILGKLLGHSQPSTTQRYAHLDADPMHRAANAIGGQISAALDGRQGVVIPLRGARGG